MKKINFTTPYDFKLSPYSGWTREHWDEVFKNLMKAIVDSASENCARQRIPGPRSHHGILADELEGFTRSMIMAGPWLKSSPDGKFQLNGQTCDVGDFYRKGILAGTDPSHNEYWGDIVDYAQHLVEMAALAWGLYLSRKHTWDAFSDSEKKQVADYMYQCTQVKYHQNNWLLFNVVTNSVLKAFGMPYSQEQIDTNLKACDDMYIDEGWYRDGNINRIDYYNSWGFLYYYLIWVIIDGDSKPDLAAKHKERARMFANQFKYFFASDGSVPCYGRSMIYRFGYLSPLALGHHLGCLDLTPGEIRTMCNTNMDFYFKHEILTDTGHLSMGYLKPCADMLEHYSCGGSPYWAAKAFNIFMMDPDNEIWTATEDALPIHQNNFAEPLKSAGFVMLGDKRSGHVQLLNQKSYHDKAEYNDRYTKFAYSSVFSYEARAVYKNYNCDNILQFSDDGINFRQRWSMENLKCEKDFTSSKYPLYEVDEDGQAFSSVLVKDDFMVNIHHVTTTKNGMVFKEGGYALGFDEGHPAIESTNQGEMASVSGRRSYIGKLCGYDTKTPAEPFFNDINGSNVRYKQSLVPWLGYTQKKAGTIMLASVVCGRIGHDTIQQLDALVSEFKCTGNTAYVRFYDGEEAFVQLGDIKNVDISLNNQKISGKVVMARVSADTKSQTVYVND